MLDKALQYLAERKKWVAAGKPVRFTDEIKQLFARCKKCNHYTGESCDICGCFINESRKWNKLAWATTVCPDDPPRWGASKEFEILKKEPPVKTTPQGGCGCRG
jgi:hypothetical protein